MKSKILLAALAALGLGAVAPVANAVTTLSLSDGTVTVLCADGAACDANGTAGAVTFIGSVGVFNLNVTTGLSTPFYPDNHMDLNSVNATSATGGTLTVMLSQNGFSGAGTYVSAIGGTSGGAVAASAYADASNALFGTGTALGATQNFGTGAFSGSWNGAYAGASPYSLTQIVSITHRGAATTSFDYELKVPEPGTLALLGLGLIGIGASRRRRI